MQSAGEVQNQDKLELKERILKVSDEYIRLTQLISPILSVPFDLEANQESIYTISGKLQAKQKLLSDLGKTSKKLFEEYKSHTNGFAKRLSLRLEGNGGKRSDAIQVSKFKWEEARTEEARVQETVTQLEAQLADTEEQAVEIRAQNTILERLKSELEVLNQDLFVGETPEFPMEDASELSVRVIEATQTFLSVEMSREKRAREKVISGIDSMSKAVEELKKGLDVSGSGSGPKVTRGAAPLLLNAKTHLARCQVIWEEACITQQIIGPLQPLEILGVHLLPGGSSNRALGERALQNSLERSYSQARNNLSLMRKELSLSRSRSQFFSQRFKLLSNQLLETKNSLMRVRSDIVQDVASGGNGAVRGEFGSGNDRGEGSSSRALPRPSISDAFNYGSTSEKGRETPVPPPVEPRQVTEDEGRSPLDPWVIRKKAIEALRQILKEVGRKDLDLEYQFETLPDYE